MRRAAIVLALLLASAAHADSGNKLLAAINAPIGSADRIWAIAFVTGTMQGFGFAIGMYGQKNGPLCMPEEVTVGQVVDVTRARLEANPAIRHETAAGHVILAAMQAWPCLTPPIEKPKKGRAL